MNQDHTTVALVDAPVNPAGRKPRRRYASEDLFTAYPIDGKLPDRNEACTQLLPFVRRAVKQHPVRGLEHRDLAQLACLVFLRTFPSYLPDDRGVWLAANRLCAAARAVAKAPLKQLKRTGRVQPLPPDQIDQRAPEPVERVAISDQAESMLAALGETDEAAAEALRLRYLEERGIGEIADLTGTPAGVVKNRLQRALQTSRQIFDVVFVAPPSSKAKKRAAIAERKKLAEERQLKTEELARQGYNIDAIARTLGVSRWLARKAWYGVRGLAVPGT